MKKYENCFKELNFLNMKNFLSLFNTFRNNENEKMIGKSNEKFCDGN